MKNINKFFYFLCFFIPFSLFVVRPYSNISIKIHSSNHCFLDIYKSSSKSARQKGKIFSHLDLDNYRQNGKMIKIIYIKEDEMTDRMMRKT